MLKNGRWMTLTGISLLLGISLVLIVAIGGSTPNQGAGAILPTLAVLHDESTAVINVDPITYVQAASTATVPSTNFPLPPSPVATASQTPEISATNTLVPAATSAPTTQPITITVPQQPVVGQVVIRFQPQTTQLEREAYVASIGGTINEEIAALDTVVVNVPQPIAAQSLPDAPVIVASEPDYFVSAQLGSEVNDPLFPDQWGLPVIGAPEAWPQLSADAPSVTVAVIDSGICADHPDLQGRILPGWDFVEDDAAPQDEFDHGCGVAGIIAANVDNEIGIAGIAPNAMIMPLRVLNGQGIGTYSDVAAAIIYAVDNGAQIINLSLGGAASSSILQDAVDYATTSDVVVIAAAGNTGANILYPAAYESVIAVGAVDQDLQLSSFSARGAGIGLLAPGRDITTTSGNGGYRAMSGTSFAAPHVAGVAVVEITLGHSLSVNGFVVKVNAVAQPTATLEPTTTPQNTVIAPTPPEYTSPSLDEAFARVAAQHAEAMGFSFVYVEAGRTISPTSDSGVIYASLRDLVSGETLPGRIDIVHAMLQDETWLFTFPGAENYTALLEALPPSVIMSIDTSPFESKGDPDIANALALNDYRLPFPDNEWATVTRSFNAHGTGEIDFDVDGRYVSAAKSGTIIYINDTNSINTYQSGAWWYWNTVVIQHGPNEYSTYAHLAPGSVPQWIKSQCSTNYGTANCSVGVQAGQIIGEEGNTGVSSAPHLHLSFGQTFVADTRYAVPTGYAWNLHNIAFTGYSTSQVAAWTYGTRLQAQGGSNPTSTCSNYSYNGIVLFDGENCEGGQRQFNSTGLRNLPDFNDRVRSIHVGGNHSVRIWEHDNRGGATRCISGSMWNLNVDHYDNGVRIYNTSNTPPGTISSIEVFNNTTCSGASNTPVPTGSVKLYSQSNGGGSVLFSMGSGVSNGPSRNTNYYTLEIPSGWTVKTYSEDNRGGDQRCWTSTVSNLQDHGWQNRIESLEVSTANICPTVLSVSPSSVNSGQSVTLSWSNLNATSNDWVSLHLASAPDSTIVNWQSVSGSSGSRSISVSAQGGVYNFRLFRNGTKVATSNNFQVVSLQAPNAPTLSSPAQNATVNRFTDVNLSWNTVSDATQYYVEFWGGPNFNVNSGWVTGTSWFAGGSIWGGSYQWRVQARNSAGESAWSDTRTLVIRYGTPSNLQATAVSRTQINLSWGSSADAPGNIQGYRIYRDGSLIGSVGNTTTSFADTNRACDTNYSYTVRAYNGSIESLNSNSASASTHECIVDTTPPTVNIISPQPGDGFNTNTLTVTATASDDVSGVARLLFYLGYDDGASAGGLSLPPDQLPMPDSTEIGSQVWGWHNHLEDTTGADGWSVTFDTSDVEDQIVAVWVYAYDHAGNVAHHDFGDIIIDRTAPAGSMSTPTRQSHQRGPFITLSADAHDIHSGVNQVEFFWWDNTQWNLLGTTMSEPYTYTWDIINVPEGFLWVSMRITDNTGNSLFGSGDEQWTFFTIDRTAPVTQVNALPSTHMTTQFNVTWGGSDNFTHSDILTYDVQVQVGCTGSWAYFVTESTWNAATFTNAQIGQRYCFRSRARDLAGNIETWPTTPDTQTTVTQAPNATTYTSFDNNTYTLYAYEGDHVALLVPANNLGSVEFDPDILMDIVNTLDAVYNYYQQVTGREPIPYRTYNGRLPIAVVPSTCGWGCGYLGFTGIELSTTAFDLLYDNVRDNNAYDQTVFYEFGRNFWLYDSELAYKNPDAGSSVVTGYAVFMRFMSMEASGVTPGPFNGTDFAVFKSEVEGLLARYLADPALDWSNTLRVGLAPDNPMNLGASDLFASFLFELHERYGDEFIQLLWKEADRRPGAVTTQQAVDNFIIAASLAANENLTGLFVNEWRWPMSISAQAEAESLFANVISPPEAAPGINRYTTLTPTLYWGSVSWATGYEIQVDNDANFSSPEFTRANLPASTTSITIIPLTRGSYYWRVRARQTNGSWGGWSDVDSFVITP